MDEARDDVALQDKAKFLTANALTLRSAPALPRQFPKEELAGIEFCGKKMRSLLLCLSRTDTEAFCQTELFVFANCKFERDQTLRRSIANWWKKEAPNMSSAEAGRRVEQIREDMDEIKHRLAFVQAADPHEAKMKVRTQLQGEIEDMQSWLSILKKFHPSV